ncbi:MAG: hypothetical protein ABJE66_11540 [Deltaproteobacteria bacterium]
MRLRPKRSDNGPPINEPAIVTAPTIIGATSELDGDIPSVVIA